MMRQSIACGIIALLAGACGAESEDRVGSAFLDVVSFGSETSLHAHGSALTGPVRHEKLHVEMGTQLSRQDVLTVQGMGAGVQVEVKAPRAGQPLLLEVEEVHSRRPESFGYTLAANGQDIYFRTYQEYGAGPNHYFVQVPANILGTGESVRITFRSEGGAPFSLATLWAYDDFFTHVAGPEGVYRKMGIIFPANLLKTREDWRVYEGLSCYAPVGRMMFNNYGFRGIKTNREALQDTIAETAKYGMPSLLLINGTGWGGKPNGPDGLGGYFSDPRYSLVQYNRAKASYQASWPSMWGNTPTPTLRDPWMNEILERRFDRVLGGMADQRALLKAAGTPAELMLIREFAPVSGEVSNFTIEKARKGGLALDPTDGFSHEEGLWMHRDAASQWQAYADGLVKVVGREAVLVDRGEVQVPEQQLLDDLYAHPDFLNEWPVNDPRWCGGQMGMVDGLWSSGEMGRGTEYRDIAMYDYLRAHGKLAMVNMERTILKEDFTVVKNHYQRGFQFLCFFNAFAGDEKYLRTVDGIDDQPALPAPHREPTVLDVRFGQTGTPGPADSVVTSTNLRVQGGFDRIRLAVATCAEPGSVLYRLGNVGEPFAAGLNLHLDGRISPGPGNRIEVYAGSDPAALQKVADLTDRELPNPDHWTPYMTSETTVDLGSSMVGQRAYYLRLVFRAAGASDAAFLLGLQVGTKWPKRSGYVDRDALNIGQMRTLQLWVQDRALAGRWLRKYREIAGEDEAYQRAADLFARGWFRSAHRILTGEISQVLPARYAVRGHGRLGRHPIEVRLPGDDSTAVLTLHRVDADGCDFTVAAAAATTMRLVFEDLKPSNGWMIESPEPGRYRLQRGMSSPAGCIVTQVGGWVAADLDYVPTAESRPRLPRTLAARYLSGGKGEIQVDLQDLELMGSDESLTIPLAKEVTTLRRPDNHAFPAEPTQEWPQPNDRVELALDEKGRVTNIVATYGYDRGVIKAFHPPVLIGELSNGEIEMENGKRYALHYDKASGTVFEMVALEGLIVAYEIQALAQALKPGQEIELTYCPYQTGDTPPRLRTIKQPRMNLLEVDYTKTSGDEWRQRAISVERAQVSRHVPEPNYLTNIVLRLLRPTEAFVPGEVVYRIEHDRPLKTTVVDFTARAFEDSSRVEFLVNAEGGGWTSCGQFDNSWQNNISQTLEALPPNFIDLTSAVQGRPNFLLKVRLVVNSADDRFCVGRLRVVTEGSEEYP